jgi:methyltransferase (TIGR00027 family)
MRADRPSVTASWVAAARGLGSLLPPEVRLAEDPCGLEFSGVVGRTLAGRFPDLTGRALLSIPRLAHWVLYMQIRTRLLDDVLLDFVHGGGRQLLLLGAGFDCRAMRFHDLLDGCRVFEVDHPATQTHKREVVARRRDPSARVSYLPWDFEHQPATLLPEALATLGHDPARPTLTIWEGVTMYLSEPAVEATVDAVRVLSARGSLFGFTYFERQFLDRPNHISTLASRFGEPFRFGWDPPALPHWLASRGWLLERDERASAAARRLLPERYAAMVADRDSHVAVAMAS